MASKSDKLNSILILADLGDEAVPHVLMEIVRNTSSRREATETKLSFNHPNASKRQIGECSIPTFRNKYARFKGNK